MPALLQCTQPRAAASHISRCGLCATRSHAAGRCSCFVQSTSACTTVRRRASTFVSSRSPAKQAQPVGCGTEVCQLGTVPGCHVMENR
jgi:hypothetical protein